MKKTAPVILALLVLALASVTVLASEPTVNTTNPSNEVQFIAVDGITLAVALVQQVPIDTSPTLNSTNACVTDTAVDSNAIKITNAQTSDTITVLNVQQAAAGSNFKDTGSIDIKTNVTGKSSADANTGAKIDSSVTFKDTGQATVAASQKNFTTTVDRAMKGNVVQNTSSGSNNFDAIQVHTAALTAAADTGTNAIDASFTASTAAAQDLVGSFEPKAASVMKISQDAGIAKKLLP